MKRLDKFQKLRNPHRYQGGWIGQAIGAAVSIGSSLLGKSAADKAAKRQRKTDKAQLALQEKADERSQALFDRYMEEYAPREEALLSEVFDRPISPDAEEAKATADVRSALSTAREMGDRNLRRHGVNPNSGAYVGLDRMRDLEGAKIEAGARTRSRDRVRDKNFARQSSMLSLGRNLPLNSAAFASQAGSLASARAGDANALAQQAGQSYGASLGNAVGTVSGLVSDWWKNRTPDVTSTTDYSQPYGSLTGPSGPPE